MILSLSHKVAERDGIGWILHVQYLVNRVRTCASCYRRVGTALVLLLLLSPVVWM